jgi:4-hydroxy-tetrahydrodipicolinate synthase
VSTQTLRETVVGPIATVPTAFTSSYDVDYARMAEATEHWIDAGLVRGRSVLKVAAAMGEGQQLREHEWSRLLRTVVDAARGRVDVMGAVHHKDTVRTIEDVKRAADVGVLALQVSPPIFNDPNQDDLLRYFGTVSEAVELGIMIYAQPWLPHGAIHPETLARMRDFERVFAIKWSPPDGVPYEAVFRLADRFSIFDNDRNPVTCRRLGGRGFLFDGISCYPGYFLGLWDLLEAHRYDDAQREYDRVLVPLSAFYRRVQERSGGEGKFEKALNLLAGLDLGPPRPPTVPLTSEELHELRELMIEWRWPIVESTSLGTVSGGARR